MSEAGAGRARWRRRPRPALVPGDDAASRSLVAVVAILTFLASLATIAAVIVAAGSAEWRSALSREATIQVRPRPGRDADADLARAVALAAATRGVAAVQPLTRSAAEGLLEPWLGRGLDLSALPVPRLAIVKLDRDARPDLAELGRRLTADVPGATLDDHGIWMSRLSAAADAVMAAAVAIVALVVAASGLAVAFATRGAVVASRDIVEVLHFVGADDRFIAREFGSRFLRLGLRGAAIGAAAAAAFVLACAELIGTPEGGASGEVDALFGTVSVGWRGIGLVAAVALLTAAIAGRASVWTVKRFLR